MPRLVVPMLRVGDGGALAQAVDEGVVRQDEVRPIRDEEAAVDGVTARLQRGDLRRPGRPGSTTIPCAITQRVWARRMPLGMRRTMTVSSPTTSVCPALGPPA